MSSEIPRSYADELDEMKARAEQRRRPTEPRGDLDSDALVRFQRCLAGELFMARMRAGLSQEQVAHLMQTTTSTVSRLETRSKSMPSTTTLLRYAEAVGCNLEVHLVTVPETNAAAERARAAAIEAADAERWKAFWADDSVEL